MNKTMQKIISLILNAILVILFFVFTVISKIASELMSTLTDAAINWMGYASYYIGLSIPVLIILALTMSISFRNEQQYSKSIFIQFVPIAAYILAEIFNMLSQI